MSSSPGNPTGTPATSWTSVTWLICIIAAIGFAFDIYELLMLPLILRPSLEELTGALPGTAAYNNWFSLLFYLPAVTGGIFGLMGGYLTDRFGRRFVLTWSILLYAFSAFFAGFSTNIWMLLFFRCTTFIGVCVEFVAAVAWLAELFPDPKQREKVLGYTQAFSSIGGLMVAIANGIALENASSFPAIALPSFLTGIFGQIGEQYQHQAWRYTLMSGLIPAIPLILIRPFLPESPVWSAKRQAGTLKRPSIAALFSPQLRRTTFMTTIGFACSLGAAFGAIQQMPQIVPGLKEVQAQGKIVGEKALAAAKEKGETNEEKLKGIAGAAARGYSQKIASEYTKVQELGGLLGRFLMAMALAGVIFWGRTLRMFQIVGLVALPLLFWYFLRIENKVFFEINLEAVKLGKLPITTMSLGMFFVGLCTVAQLSFWGNYLPHVYPVHLRGTGESFAANIGGRMIGTSAAAITAQLASILPYGVTDGPLKFATAAAIVGGICYLIGLIASFGLTEPKDAIVED
jgi:MFS family permease